MKDDETKIKALGIINTLVLKNKKLVAVDAPALPDPVRHVSGSSISHVSNESK